jgi:regulatory protein
MGLRSGRAASRFGAARAGFGSAGTRRARNSARDAASDEDPTDDESSAEDDNTTAAPSGHAADPVHDIRQAALHLLARREHSTAELRERLARKFGHDAETIEAELERLTAERLLDDTRFTESFIRMHCRKGHGPLRILQELARRGVSSELAEGLVDPRGAEWTERARAWRARRFGAAEPTAAADWQRQARHLQSRGFSTEQVRRALRAPED